MLGKARLPSGSSRHGLTPYQPGRGTSSTAGVDNAGDNCGGGRQRPAATRAALGLPSQQAASELAAREAHDLPEGPPDNVFEQH
jgi:hypothetical protein